MEEEKPVMMEDTVTADAKRLDEYDHSQLSKPALLLCYEEVIYSAPVPCCLPMSDLTGPKTLVPFRLVTQGYFNLDANPNEAKSWPQDMNAAVS